MEPGNSQLGLDELVLVQSGSDDLMIIFVEKANLNQQLK